MKTEKKSPPLLINFGPQHSSVQGALRMVLEVDEELVERVDPHIGFLHRGVEKLIEHRTYTQAIPYFDRLDYVSPISQEHAFALAVEKLLDIEVPLRARHIRVMFSELTRILNHLLNISTCAACVGAVAPTFAGFDGREKIMEFFERTTGARMNVNYICPGGVRYDLPDGLMDDILKYAEGLPQFISDVEELLTENRIFKSRTVDIGAVQRKHALAWGFSGPMLRASGVPWDLRKSQPYEIYDSLDFDIPVGTTGDCYARYLVRVEEMRQSGKIIKQCIDAMPLGHVIVDDHEVAPPLRAEIRISEKSFNRHLKFYSEGYEVPAGETYTAVESPKGEFGVYLVSDGTNKPYRCHARSAGFAHLQAADSMCKGHALEDVGTIVGSMDLVLGEVDR